MNLIEAVPKLIETTSQGKLEWESLGTNSFVASIGKVLVSVTYSSNNYAISLLDEGGATLEHKVYSSVSGSSFQSMKQLYDLARRRALNIDSALAELMKGLESL